MAKHYRDTLNGRTFARLDHSQNVPLQDDVSVCPGCMRTDCSEPFRHDDLCQCRLDRDDPRRTNRKAMCTSWHDA